MEEIRDIGIEHYKLNNEYEFYIEFGSLKSRLRAIKTILFRKCLKVRGNDWMAENLANHILENLKEH